MLRYVSILVRWAGSLLIGAIVVYLLLVAGLYFSGWFEDESTSGVQTRAIELLGEIDRVRLEDELMLAPKPSRPPPPPVVLPRRVSGFVQLEVEVGTGGRVVSAKVLGAVPEGFYEEQALQEVQQRLYEPSPIGRYRQVEVVPFTVTVDPGETQPGG